MSSHSSSPQSTEKYLQLWIYFLPLVGIIPAIWTLYRTRDCQALECQNNPLVDYPQLQSQIKASRRSINLTLAWLCAYVLFNYGSSSATAIVSFRLLFANAAITTGYFLTCTILMARLGKKKLFYPD